MYRKGRDNSFVCCAFTELRGPYLLHTCMQMPGAAVTSDVRVWTDEVTRGQGVGQMKSGGAAKKAKGKYVKDENPALRTVVAGLKKVGKELVPGTQGKVEGWGG